MPRLRESELNREIAHWRGILTDVDNQIEMPDSLRGEALRHKLNQAPPVKSVDYRRRFVMRAAVSYAVMFALVVSFGYVLWGGNLPITTTDQYTAPQAAGVGIAPMTEEEESWLMYGDNIAAFDAPIARIDLDNVIPLPPGTMAPSVPITPPVPLAPESRIEQFDIEHPRGVFDDVAGSIYLGGWNGHVFNWIPHYSDFGSPMDITFEIVSNDGFLQMPVRHMSRPNEFIVVDDDILVLIGAGLTDEFVIVRSYFGFSHLLYLYESGSVTQPGAHVATQISDGIAYTVSYWDWYIPGWDMQMIVPQRGWTGQGMYYISALNMHTGESHLAGIRGMFEQEISLTENYLELNYQMSDANGQLVVGTFRVVFDGLQFLVEE